MDRRIIVGGKYRHFKNKYYRVLCIALHSETLEELVVYQAQYGTGGIYARPVGMFLEKVDRDKYPDADQDYRFELIEEDGGTESEKI